MKLKPILVLLFLCFMNFSYAEEDIAVLNRSDNIPKESVDGADDQYFEGYIQALVDMHYYEYRVVVIVKEGNVWLANMPKNACLRQHQSEDHHPRRCRDDLHAFAA